MEDPKKAEKGNQKREIKKKDWPSIIRERFKQSLEDYKSDKLPEKWSLENDCRRFGRNLKHYLNTGNNPDELRKEIASLYLSMGYECAAARTLSNGRLLGPTDYSWMLGKVISESPFYEPIKVLNAYVERFFIKS
jgi:hypothetical protein